MNIHTENLYRLIRNEDVIIWAGAGCSIYAGFPSGTDLAKIIYSELTDSEKILINKDLCLPDLTEEFCKLKGNKRNPLLRILNKVFCDYIPTSKELHEKLASIPHFKTIITTNYDNLFEAAYGNTQMVALIDKHIPYLEKNKVHIFKVHGDLSEPDSIIITKSDYDRFFSDSINNLYWSVIKKHFASNSILFIGYNLSDPNISAVFDKVYEVLNSHMKECFLVAPDLSESKIKELKQKGITYIDTTAEALIDGLVENIKNNIIGDFEKGNISAETFNLFLQKQKLIPYIQGDLNNYKLKALSGMDGKIDCEMNLTVKNDDVFIKELNDYISGIKFGEFEISEDKLLNAIISVGGLKLPESGEGISKIRFKSNPTKETIIDIRFTDGFELTNIPIKYYASPHAIKIIVEYKNQTIEFYIKLDCNPILNVNFNFVHTELYSNTKDEIEILTLLRNVASGKEFTIYFPSGGKYTKSFPYQEILLKESEIYLEYFIKLRIIELHYNIKFSDIAFNSITNKSFDLINKIIAVINNDITVSDWDKEILMELADFSDATLKQISLVNESNAPVIANYKVNEIVDLHGHKINIGYKRVEICDSYISNLDAILKGEEKTVKVRSRTKMIKTNYTKEIE